MTCIIELCPGETDEAVAELAHREGRLLLTEDKDFGQLFVASGQPSTGVILIRYPFAASDRLGADVVAAVRQLGDRLTGRIAVLQPGRIRLTEPPSQV